MAWQSEERHQLQADIKEGLDKFVAEVDGALKSMREKEPVKKAGEAVQKTAEDVKLGKVSSDIRKGTVTALRRLSESLDRMATSFTPVEGSEDSSSE
jgi:hypothetical protein